MKQEYYKPTPGRFPLVCWTCNYDGHRARRYSTKWRLLPTFDEPKCARCSQLGHKLHGSLRKKPPGFLINRSTPKKQNQGFGQEISGWVAHVKMSKRRSVQFWACGQVGHFVASCPGRECWFCGEVGHLKRNYPIRNRGNNPWKGCSRMLQNKCRQLRMLHYVDDERFLLLACISRRSNGHWPQEKDS